jgi:hypothetical protein
VIALRAHTAILVTLLVTLLAATASREARAQSNPETTSPSASAGRDTSGLIVPRLGTFDGRVGNDPYMLRGAELSILVQPWRAHAGPHRGLFVSGRVGGRVGDFSSFYREGLELGYLYKTTSRLRFVTLGASMSATADRWEVWVESPDPGDWDGSGYALGGSLRPFVRLGRFEVSFPLEVGYGFGPGEHYRSHGVQVGVVLF